MWNQAFDAQELAEGLWSACETMVEKKQSSERNFQSKFSYLVLVAFSMALESFYFGSKRFLLLHTHLTCVCSLPFASASHARLLQPRAGRVLKNMLVLLT